MESYPDPRTKYKDGSPKRVNYAIFPYDGAFDIKSCCFDLSKQIATVKARTYTEALSIAGKQGIETKIFALIVL